MYVYVCSVCVCITYLHGSADAILFLWNVLSEVPLYLLGPPSFISLGLLNTLFNFACHQGCP